MKERPIIFNGEMVRAIRDWRKTQTRRVIKWGAYDMGNWDLPRGRSDTDHGYPFFEDRYGDHYSVATLCPYGQPGDRLYVRETFADLRGTGISGSPDKARNPMQLPVAYAAHETPESREARLDYGIKWTPSIHMPKWAARIWLEITDVRVELLQDISGPDASAEGVSHSSIEVASLSHQWKTSIQYFRDLWDSVAKPNEQWDANPWVWVINFKKIEKE